MGDGSFAGLLGRQENLAAGAVRIRVLPSILPSSPAPGHRIAHGGGGGSGVLAPPRVFSYLRCVPPGLSGCTSHDFGGGFLPHPASLAPGWVVLSHFRFKLRHPGFFLSPGGNFLHPSRFFLNPGRNFLHPYRFFLNPGRNFLHPSRFFLSPGRNFLNPSGFFLSPGRNFLHPSRFFLSPVRNFLNPFRFFLPPGRNFLSPFRFFLSPGRNFLNPFRFPCPSVPTRPATFGAG